MFQKEIFCSRLKSLRLEQGLTLEQFGKVFGLSKQVTSHWETGIRVPHLPVLIQMADFFDVSLDYLTGRCDQRENFGTRCELIVEKTEPENFFASRIHELRLAKGLTQKELGDAVGLSAKAISTIENGSRVTSIEKLVELAKCFSVSTDYLLGMTDNPAQQKGK